ncbi:restriction endonuclease subunit S [Faecousia sp. CLA-AA-H192]|jgi:type I restriction enzyme S subunit|uniref:Restriction endonuclease subunit S n=1 Tax=Faecousia intestinalis TaxID=3133167 RepID=A0ABV1G6M2_9FIRM
MTAQQLKNSILQMAVQGKLVPQDPNDEPASVLLERIRAEKERLIKEKKIKREKNPSVIFKGADNTPYEKIGDEVRSLADLVPFEIPSSWEWCRVGDLFSNMSGLAYKKDALAIKADKMIRVLRGGNIGEEQFLFKGDDVFISSELVKPELYLRKNYMITPAVSSLDHIGKIALIDKDYSDTVVGGFVLMLIPHFNDDVVSEYLLYAFAAKHHRDNCRNITHKSGQAFYNLSREQMMNLPVPIPPREEMGRIIAMLKRVLPKVADYAVVDTALQNLNGSFPETLKKSILQEAVQGKLVPQDPSDEPAEALLERIRAEKQRLIKEGKIKKDKHESVIFRRDNSHYEKLDGVERCIDDELPFEIPESWAWTYLGNISFVTKLAGFEYTKYIAPALTNHGIPLFKGKNIQNGKLIEHFEWFIPETVSDELWRSQLSKRCLLTPYVGSIGNVAVFPGTYKAHLGSNVGKIEPYSGNGVLIEYILFYLRSTTGYEQLTKYKKATAQESISIDAIRNVLMPIPPLNEQERIVSAIDTALSIVQKL